MSPPRRTPANDTAADSFNQVCTVRIELLETDPPIWREVEVPTSVTLKVLHEIVQAAMGWFDYHLWEFKVGDRTYGLPMDEDWGTAPRIDAYWVRLRDVLSPGTTVISYLYDFGDAWEHRLTVTGIRQGKPEVSYPHYVGGERANPPEDCGGITGFYDMLEAWTDPEHSEHARVVEFLEDWNPEEIDELPLRIALKRIANRRNAVRARIAKKI